MRTPFVRTLIPLATLVVALTGSGLGQAELIDNGDGTVTQTIPGLPSLMWLKDANQAATTGYPAVPTARV